MKKFKESMKAFFAKVGAFFKKVGSFLNKYVWHYLRYVFVPIAKFFSWLFHSGQQDPLSVRLFASLLVSL